ncbi:MAG: hypothetical protein ACYCOU_01960 [Sulfobacillus sp.]
MSLGKRVRLDPCDGNVDPASENMARFSDSSFKDCLQAIANTLLVFLYYPVVFPNKRLSDDKGKRFYCMRIYPSNLDSQEARESLRLRLIAGKEPAINVFFEILNAEKLSLELSSDDASSCFPSLSLEGAIGDVSELMRRYRFFDEACNHLRSWFMLDYRARQLRTELTQVLETGGTALRFMPYVTPGIERAF